MVRVLQYAEPCDGQVHRLRQQLLHAFFAQQAAELDQGGGIAWQALLVVRMAREVLPARRLAPTLHHGLVAEVEGVFEVEQRDHGAQGHARAPGVGLASQWRWCLTKQVQIGQRLTGVCAAGEEMRHRSLDLLPRHA
jgi:hypothetical protein